MGRLDKTIMEEVASDLWGDSENNSLLVPFFNLLYYLTFVPFKTTFDPKTGTYSVKVSHFQRVLCGLSYTLAILCVFSSIAASVSDIWSRKDSDSEPVIVLVIDIICDGCILLSALSVTRILWWRHDLYLAVVECVRPRFLRRRRITYALIGFIVILSVIFMGFVNWYTIFREAWWVDAGNDTLQNSNATTPFEVGDYAVNVFSIGQHISDAYPDSDITLWVLVALATHGETFMLLLQGILVVGSVAMSQIGRQFEMELEISLADHDMEKGYQLYRRLKETTDSFRTAFGNHLLAFYVTSVCFYAQTPYVLIGKRGDSEKAMLMYFVASGFVWIVAAEFHHKMRGALLNWVQVCSEDNELGTKARLKVISVSNEMAADPVGLGSRCFAVTYQHLAGMTGLIATYALIVFQLHSSDKS